MNILKGIFKQPIYELADIKEAMSIGEPTPKQAREEALNRFVLKKNNQIKLLGQTVIIMTAVIGLLLAFIIITDDDYQPAPTELQASRS